MATITIIEEYETYIIAECRRCGGKGYVSAGTDIFLRPKGTDCPTCSGNGKVKIEGNPPFPDCGRCGGSGNKSGTCSNCGGVGVISGDDLESY
jgi:DnaJ-class molecular chaperone